MHHAPVLGDGRGGIFEVERHDGDAAVMVNLVDELTYRVCSNAGP
jgi:hypothetical protein